MGSYKMGVNDARMEMEIEVIGCFTPEQAETFMMEYNSFLSFIKATDHTLRIDYTDLTVVTPDLAPILEASCSLYNSTNFKKVIFEIKNNTTVEMQLNRIVRKVGLKVDVIEIQQSLT